MPGATIRPGVYRHAYRLDTVITALRADPTITVALLAARLAEAGHPTPTSSIYRLRREALALLDPARRPELPRGWTRSDAAQTLGVARARLQAMVDEVGLDDFDPATRRASPQAWRTLPERFEKQVWRREAVREHLGRTSQTRSGLPWPPPAGHDAHGHWWRPADVRRWIARHATRLTRPDIAAVLDCTPADLDHFLHRPDFPPPTKSGEWYEHEVRRWRAQHRDDLHQTAQEWLSLREVAAASNLSYDSVRTYRSKGLLPPPDTHHQKSPRWHRDTVTTWNDQRRRHQRTRRGLASPPVTPLTPGAS